MFKFVVIVASLNGGNSDLTLSFIYEDIASIQECVMKQPELLASVPQGYEIVGYKCEKVENEGS